MIKTEGENRIVSLHYMGAALAFETNQALFSPRYIDKGTLTMLGTVQFSPDDIVLDLGCGYGVVGIVAAQTVKPEHIYMTDVNSVAIACSALNLQRNQVTGVQLLQSDLYEALGDYRFTKILCNPPYHTDFSIAKRIIEGGYRRLLPEGELYLVTKRKEWYKRKCISVFGGVKITEKDGYFVFRSVKKKSLDTPQF